MRFVCGSYAVFDVRCSFAVFDVRCSLFDFRYQMFDIRCLVFGVLGWRVDEKTGGVTLAPRTFNFRRT